MTTMFPVNHGHKKGNVSNHDVHGVSGHRVPQVVASETAKRTSVREPARSPQDALPCDRLQGNGRRAAAIMLQGTGSDAGKSIMAAALCRILLQDGVRVAPFKAQNMSLNSFVTRDGLEMGRAQVVQAQAARIDPDVRMNPVLLKPSSEVGSQVIVNGRPVGNMKVAEYIAYKPQAAAAAHRAYDELAAEYDVIVLEGAGSPGEINLKSHDIVNMEMARYAAAPVLLVGDIERGGVFASLVGHFELMEPWERELLAGYVINRFRGDASLLDPALEFMISRTGRPVLGVVPYLSDLGLPQEDSVSFKQGLYTRKSTGPADLRLAVIDLPHISNFTDLEPFLAEPDVAIGLVRRPEELGEADVIILPGSKNVIADLAFLRRTGLDVAITEAVTAGKCEIVGICGGFQMLGRTIADPLGLETVTGNPDINSTSRSNDQHQSPPPQATTATANNGEPASPPATATCRVTGLGLLPLETTLAPEKTLVQRRFTHLASGLEVHGYEIHHGQSQVEGAPALQDGPTPEGACSPNGLIWGSYLHGIFDADHFRRWFIDRLRQRRGLTPLTKIQAPYDLEPAFDRLAATVRQALDMEQIYRLLDKGNP
ncbi:cobyric acid synthase [Desulfurivibrio dismutans]|uniref:cobyric acid synthase n=1 Tax=Desulfurivibrio dismutans TaxID=1398908 RepID=UPI0023DB5D83|nr:cobyric acid synthase [Desulfurivibrio alkaliphilus]MDF1613347.1 cobyric acid synthase [Desulfurivibrio alkaliphilus]